MKRLSGVIALVVCLLAAGRADAQNKIPPGYAGSNACRGCHADLAASFFRNAHFKTSVDAEVPFEKKGCESCHGPGRAHIEGKGDKSKIIAFSRLSAKETLDNCLQCHSKQISRANSRRSSHTTADVACNSCHNIHKAATPKQLLAKPQTELCYTCHANIRAQFSMPVKHRVNEGFMQCSDCHNPHGADAPTWRMSARPRMMAHGLQNEEPCLKCHVDKRGPFVFEHAAVRVDGCGSCHMPHGSMNARLMRRPQVFTMCLECHSGLGSTVAGGGFGRQDDNIKLTPSSHSLTDPKYQNCTLCHTKIHGSNAHERFLR